MENEELNRYTPDEPKAPDVSCFYRPEPLSEPSVPESPVPVQPSQTSYEQQPVENPAPQPAASYNPQPAASYNPQSAAGYTPQPEQPARPAAAPVPPAYTPPTPNRYTPEPPKKAKKKGIGVIGIIAIALCCSLAGGALGAFVYSLFVPVQEEEKTESFSDKAEADNDETPNTTNVLQGLRENSVIEIAEIDTSKQLTAAEVYALNVKSTVGITTSITTNFWGFQSTSAASGSGFIISDDGYILTNYHVVEGSNSITVALYDGTEYDAVLVGYDASNDIAVLKVDAEGLPPVILGDSDNLNVGDPVVAIGNPLGELTFSLTSGVVSAMDRSVVMSQDITMNLIQTDCAINSGNSGGALFNLYGEVIGITNAKYSSNGFGTSIDNIGFAIPLNDIWGIVESIIEKGYVSKPYIGVSVADVKDDDKPDGATVIDVTKNSPAEESGLKADDIITHVNGDAISGSSDLVDRIGDSEVGEELTLTVYRDGQTIELKLTVGEQIQRNTTEETSSGK